MAGFRDLQIYQLGYELAIRVHKLSLELPKHELYEQGSHLGVHQKALKIRYQKAMVEGNIKLTLRSF